MFSVEVPSELRPSFCQPPPNAAASFSRWDINKLQLTFMLQHQLPAREILFALRVSTSQAESIWCCFFSFRFSISAARLAQCSGASVGFSIATLITRLNSSASPHRNFSGTQRQVVFGFPRVHNARNGLFANASIRRMRPRRALFISQLGETCSFPSDLSFLGRMRRRNAPPTEPPGKSSCCHEHDHNMGMTPMGRRRRIAPRDGEKMTPEASARCPRLRGNSLALR
ncbi:hypothetical protein K456DRAFT_1298368 [Colletotrichum gloeosporioides 23]|nr:hypothetical protein K456DRAFT_1298368 [Colletotrichum gloeosporioides 23]